MGLGGTLAATEQRKKEKVAMAQRATNNVCSNARMARMLSHMISPGLASQQSHDYMQASKDSDPTYESPMR